MTLTYIGQLIVAVAAIGLVAWAVIATTDDGQECRDQDPAPAKPAPKTAEDEDEQAA